MTTTTQHTEIGYTCNLEIIERALREQFGFDDCSHVQTALAAHVWSQVNRQTGTGATWGTKEIANALAQLRARVEKMESHLASLK